MKRRDFITKTVLSALSMSMPNFSIFPTLEDKISQLIIIDAPPEGITQGLLSYLKKYNPNGIFLRQNIFKNKQYAIEKISQIKEQFKTKPFVATDLEGGIVNWLSNIKKFPSARSIGQNYQKNLISIESIEYCSYEKGKILNELGLNLNFDPVADLSNRSRSYSNNPNLVSEIIPSIITCQYEEGILTTAKHFPGIGQVTSDTHKYLPILNKTKNQLFNYELIPFKSAIEANVPLIMIGHILVPNIDSNNPTSLSYEIITNLLRKELNYRGLIITDSLTMGAINIHYSRKKVYGGERIKRRCIDAIKAGNDIILNFDYKTLPLVISSIKKAVINKEISEQRINESYERVQIYKTLI